MSSTRPRTSPRILLVADDQPDVLEALRLFVVGAVHITQALVPMAGLLGYAVTVIDPVVSPAAITIEVSEAV